MPSRPAPPWIRRLVDLSLRTWPGERRRSHGPSVHETVGRLAREARRSKGPLGTLGEVVAECASVALAGVGMRLEGVAVATREVLRGLAGDVRFALRTLARSPGFAVAATLTLAVGLGANTAVFSLVDGVLLRPLPYADPDRLVLVWSTLPSAPSHVPLAAPDVAILRQRATRLQGIGFVNRGSDGAIVAREGDAADHVRVASVTAGFFDVLGVAPALGRTFESGDALSVVGGTPPGTVPTTDGPLTGGPAGPPEGAPPVAIIAHGIWSRILGSDPSVVGRTVRIDGRPVVVVGVMPPGFRLALPLDAGIDTDVDVWMPLRVPLTALRRTDGRLLDQDSDNTGAVVARLAPGATVEQARDEVRGVAADLRDEVPAYAVARMGLDVRSLPSDATAHARPLLTALLAGVGVVLLVACLNLATLLLARGMDREWEMVVRAALGARRWRLTRQLLVESAVLVALGTAAAAGVAGVGLSALEALVPPELAPGDGLALDLRTLAFVAGLGAAAVVLFGLAPALRTSAWERRGLAGPGRLRRGSGAGRTRSAFVVGQVALAVVLVLSAGLLLRTVVALRDVRPGFDPADALTFRVSLRVPGRYDGPRDRARFMKEIETTISRLPGVRAAGLVGVLPLGGHRWTQPYGLPGQSESQWQENRADFRVVTSGYFEALGARLLEGRTFTAQEDLVEDERVVIVDERLARRLAPRGSALGVEIGIPLDGAAVRARVVGVVEHVRHDDLDIDGREAVYVPYRQEASRDVAWVVRSTGSPLALAPAVKRALESVDPQLAVYELRTLDSYVANAVAPRRFALTLLASFALMALACAATGLYGVVAYEVGRSTREIGVRMALGAARAAVVRGVLARGLRMGLTGVGAGVALAAVAAAALRSLLFGVGAADPLTWAAVVPTVLGVTIAACWIPARRASRLDPTEALRAE